MLTPQQLMDLPGAGMAEKQLRKDGRWRLTAQEKVSALINDAMHDIEDAYTSVTLAFDKLEELQ